MTNVFVKKLHPDAKLPVYSSEEAAGADLCSLDTITIAPHNRGLIPTGLSIQLSKGFEAQIRPRSGLALKHGITVLNTPGTIDSDYRGAVGVILFNTTDAEFQVNAGDRIAQMVIAPVVRADFMEAGELGRTERGEGGFGSTGVSSERIAK